MTPIGKYIVVTPLNEKIKTASGLLLSGDDVDNLRYKKGTVVKPGTEVSSIKEEDTIYFDKRSGFTMLIGDIPYTIILERDVIVIL